MSSMIKKLVSRVEMMLGKAMLTALDDSGDLQLVKLSGLANEDQDGIERLQNYGLSSLPPNGSEMLVAYLNGNRDHGVVVVCDSGAYRPKGLKPGETILYSMHGQTIYLDEDKNIVVTSKPGEVTPTEIQLNGADDYAVAFNDLKAGFDALVAYVNALVLPVNLSTLIAGPPAVPSTASIDASKVDIVRLP